MPNTEQITSNNANRLSDSEMENFVAGSFLRNVPELMLEGKSFEEAVKLAYERDQEMLIRLQIVAERKRSHSFHPFGKDEAYSELIDQMSKNLWIRFNEKNSEQETA